jgi:hypothetical protein
MLFTCNFERRAFSIALLFNVYEFGNAGASPFGEAVNPLEQTTASHPPTCLLDRMNTTKKK